MNQITVKPTNVSEVKFQFPDGTAILAYSIQRYSESVNGYVHELRVCADQSDNFVHANTIAVRPVPMGSDGDIIIKVEKR